MLVSPFVSLQGFAANESTLSNTDLFLFQIEIDIHHFTVADDCHPSVGGAVLRMPDLQAKFSQRHSVEAEVAAFVGGRDIGVVFDDDKRFHGRVSVAQNPHDARFVENLAA